MNGKSWAIFGVIVAALLGGMVYFAMQGKLDVSDIPEGQLTQGTIPPEERNGNIGDNRFGNDTSKVTLVEYGDYQCPGCSAAYQAVKTVTEKYKGQLTFVFRNLPIVSLHPNARAAAAASQAAGLQGKYWQMHNLLYENQQNWSNLSASERGSQFNSYASQLGLNISQFEQDMASTRVAKKIDFDMAIAGRQHADQTPFFFLDGKPVDQYAKDGKVVDKSVEGAQAIWGDPDTLDKLVVRPALEKAGFKLKND